MYFDQDSPQLIPHYESRDILTGNANNKNKYINRIHAMMHEGARDPISDITSLAPDRRPKLEIEDNVASDKFSDKLAKSRLSAKMSR